MDRAEARVGAQATFPGPAHRRGGAASSGGGSERLELPARVMPRRARSGPYEAERRRADRRLPSKVDALLRAIGWAIVPLDVTKNHHQDAALQ